VKRCPWGAVKGVGSRVEALNGTRRRGVVLDLVVALEPVPLREGYPAVLASQNTGRISEGGVPVKRLRRHSESLSCHTEDTILHPGWWHAVP